MIPTIPPELREMMGNWWDTDVDNMTSDDLRVTAILYAFDCAADLARAGHAERSAAMVEHVRERIKQLDAPLRDRLSRQLGIDGDPIPAVAGHVKVRRSTR